MPSEDWGQQPKSVFEKIKDFVTNEKGKQRREDEQYRERAVEAAEIDRKQRELAHQARLAEARNLKERAEQQRQEKLKAQPAGSGKTQVNPRESSLLRDAEKRAAENRIQRKVPPVQKLEL